MSQCSYVNVKHTGTAELTQSVQPSARLRLLLAFTAPCPGPPGMDGFGVPPGQSLSPPASVEGAAPLRRGRGPSSPPENTEPFGRSQSLASLAVSAAGHGRMVVLFFFSPPELSCDRVNPQGIDTSVPAFGAASSPRCEDQLGAGEADGALASHALVPPPCTPCPWRRVRFASPEGAAAEGQHPSAPRRRAPCRHAQAHGAKLRLWSGDSF